MRLFKTEKGIPIPPIRSQGSRVERIRETVKGMRNGESFVIPANAYAQVRDIGKQLEVPLTTRKISGDKIRVWKNPDAK